MDPSLCQTNIECYRKLYFSSLSYDNESVDLAFFCPPKSNDNDERLVELDICSQVRDFIYLLSPKYYHWQW